MKNSIKYFGIALIALFGLQSQAQETTTQESQEMVKSIWDRDIPNFRQPDKRGVNDFEAPKDWDTYYDGVQVRVGGASTIQFQDLDQENSSTVELHELGGNFNLATANLDLDVLLYDGVRMHLRTYLSSQHHSEAWVKGGYIQIDKLDFIREGFAEDFMKYARVKIGHMENNYGDAHFRRTDNAMALHNPFVGNYLMDSFTTEVGAEVYFFKNGWLGMAGFSNGKLNQSTVGEGETSPSLLAKVGYDDYVTEDLRFRLTGSVYHTAHSKSVYLYSGDRAGSRYYNVMTGPDGGDGFRAGRINPDLKNEVTSFMINPFLKYGGLEFFGIFEVATGKKSSEANERTWNQYSGELIYRFGETENFYVGGRYNRVDGELTGSNIDVDVDRFQLAAGWFMTKNILAKLEYVTQNYNGYPTDDIHSGGKFNGFMVEAAISF